MAAVPLLLVFLHLWGTSVCQTTEELLPVTYDKGDYPAPLEGGPMQLELLLRVLEVNHVNEDEAELTMTIRVHLFWKDPRLLINHEEEVVWLHIGHKNNLWIPDLTVLNLKEMKMLKAVHNLENLKLLPHQILHYVFDCELTIVCNMDFGLFPLDWQHCPVEFASYQLPMSKLRFKWRGEGVLMGRIPDKLTEYEVDIYKSDDEIFDDPNSVLLSMNEERSILRIELLFHRRLRNHILQTYIPSFLIIGISWISFVIPPKIVPGRMVLLVTSLLTLVTMYSNVRSNTPAANSIKCIELWLIGCTFFIFCAILEYAIIMARVFHFNRDVPDAEESKEPDTTKCRACLRSLHPLDRVSLLLFPIVFIIFTCAYWGAFLGPVLANHQEQMNKLSQGN